MGGSVGLRRLSRKVRASHRWHLASYDDGVFEKNGGVCAGKGSILVKSVMKMGCCDQFGSHGFCSRPRPGDDRSWTA